MKHCAIKGVPVRLSEVWWAGMSLRSSGAVQLINHQGGARRECSLKSFITMLGGMQSPGHISVLLFSPPQHPQCWLLNQHARLPGKRCMESEVARECNQKLSHVHCNSKFIGLYQDKLQQSSKWTWQARKWKARSLAFWSDFPKARRHSMMLPLPSVLSRRVVSGVANTNRLHLESQDHHLGEKAMTNFCRASELQPARPAVHSAAPADCPLDFWRTRQQCERAQISPKQETTVCPVNSTFALCCEQGMRTSKEHLR